MQKHTNKSAKFPWKAVVTGLGIVGSLILIGETAFRIWTYVKRPLIESHYIGMTGECLDRFMSPMPGQHEASKLHLGPRMGLNAELQSAYLNSASQGTTVHSVIFLALKNAT